MVGKAVTLRPGERFLDACAAPGSKTTLIAGDSESTFIVAGDRYWPRVEFLRKNCRSQGVTDVAVVQYDAEEALPFAEATFDTVLVDVPCSGTGTIRHNPEIRYFLDPTDFEALSKKQLQIVQNASKLVKPGGRLIYSTCSLEVEENERVIEQFLCHSRGFSSERPNVPARFLSESGTARTFPPRDNMDGFFIAALKRPD
jgi:16S rRNA (cytosine967-C5)-methyltransferase